MNSLSLAHRPGKIYSKMRMNYWWTEVIYFEQNGEWLDEDGRETHKSGREGDIEEREA